MAKKTKNIQYYEAVGRRKEAVARVRLYLVTAKEKAIQLADRKIVVGQILVNNQPIEKIYPSAADKQRYLLPLQLTNCTDRFAISIQVRGGGKKGQLDAIIHGLARALCLVDKDNHRPLLKKQGLLRRDPRSRERRKAGTGGKARRIKQSPKR